MAGVRKKGRRLGNDPGNRLAQDERGVETDPHRKCAAEVRRLRRMGMPVVVDVGVVDGRHCQHFRLPYTERHVVRQ